MVVTNNFRVYFENAKRLFRDQKYADARMLFELAYNELAEHNPGIERFGACDATEYLYHVCMFFGKIALHGREACAAEGYFRQALALNVLGNPGRASAARFLGIAAYEQGRRNEALSWTALALHCETSLPSVLNERDIDELIAQLTAIRAGNLVVSASMRRP